VADWVTISALATAGGTLALAAATLGSVRSANRAARVAERSLLVGLRPLLVPSRGDDQALKVTFADDRWYLVAGGAAEMEATEAAIYLVVSLRNVGSGLAVLHGWRVDPVVDTGGGDAPDLATFHRLTRDIFIAAGDIGFWQGALRDPASAEFAAMEAAIRDRQRMTVDLLYGDYEGGQRAVTRLALLPGESGRWIAAASRYWSIDGVDPR
jgi:hypothetical protein